MSGSKLIHDECLLVFLLAFTATTHLAGTNFWILFSVSLAASQTAISVFSTLASQTSSMDSLVSKAFTEVQQISLATHQAMLSSINADLALSNSISSTVTATGTSV